MLMCYLRLVARYLTLLNKDLMEVADLADAALDTSGPNKNPYPSSAVKRHQTKSKSRSEPRRLQSTRLY